MTKEMKYLLNIIKEFKAHELTAVAPQPEMGSEDEIMLMLKGFKQSIVGDYWVLYSEVK